MPYHWAIFAVHGRARCQSLRGLLTHRIRRASWASPPRAFPCLQDPGTCTRCPSPCRSPLLPTTRGSRPPKGPHRLPLEPPSSAGGSGWRPRSPTELGSGLLARPSFEGHRFGSVLLTSAQPSELPPPVATMDPLGAVRGLHGRARLRARDREAPLPPGCPEVSLVRDAMPPRARPGRSRGWRKSKLVLLCLVAQQKAPRRTPGLHEPAAGWVRRLRGNQCSRCLCTIRSCCHA